jgi:hypothetical protein
MRSSDLATKRLNLVKRAIIATTDSWCSRKPILTPLRYTAITLIVSAIVVLHIGLANAQDKTPAKPADPTQLSLDELMKAEIYSASKQWQTKRAPSSISIVTADHPKVRVPHPGRNPSACVALCHQRPKLQLYRIRGLARPQDYNRMLLLVNGHRLRRV